MAVPGAPLNYPLAILAIFLRRLVDRIRKTPRSVILKQSVWYSTYLLTQEQWPALVAVVAFCCTLGKLCRYRAPVAMAKLAKIKAKALNSSLKKKCWLHRRKSWLKKFRERKTREPALKVGVTNLLCKMQNRSTFQRSVEEPRRIFPTNFLDKSTYVPPALSFNKCSQTEEAIVLDKTISEISLGSHNSSPKQEAQEQPQWQNECFAKPYSEDEEILDDTKYLDPMCDILPMGGATYSDYAKDDDKWEDDEAVEEFVKPVVPIKKKRRKQHPLNLRKHRKVPKKGKIKETLSDGFLIRKTRSGKVYGYTGGK